jgi:hypothetical protein
MKSIERMTHKARRTGKERRERKRGERANGRAGAMVLVEREAGGLGLNITVVFFRWLSSSRVSVFTVENEK